MSEVLLYKVLHSVRDKEKSKQGCLTFEGDGRVSGAGLLHLTQAKQCGGEERVVDEVLHVVALTLLLGLGSHLIRHILPAGMSSWGEKGCIDVLRILDKQLIDTIKKIHSFFFFYSSSEIVFSPLSVL